MAPETSPTTDLRVSCSGERTVYTSSVERTAGYTEDKPIEFTGLEAARPTPTLVPTRRLTLKNAKTDPPHERHRRDR